MIENKCIKLFTYQSNAVIDIINRDGVYFPDFEYEDEKVNSYKFLLDEYNSKNNTDYKGLVFGIGFAFNKRLDSFDDYRDAIVEMGCPSGTYTDAETYKVLEIDISKLNEHTVDIDFYRFTDLIFFMDIEPESGEVGIDNMRRMKNNIYNPNYGDEFELVQTNISRISKDMIIAIHDAEDFYEAYEDKYH